MNKHINKNQRLLQPLVFIFWSVCVSRVCVSRCRVVMFHTGCTQKQGGALKDLP